MKGLAEFAREKMGSLLINVILIALMVSLFPYFFHGDSAFLPSSKQPLFSFLVHYLGQVFFTFCRVLSEIVEYFRLRHILSPAPGHKTMAPENDIPAAANILGTIGTALFSVQLVPQIWHNWQHKKTDGLPASFMFLWAISMFCSCYLL